MNTNKTAWEYSTPEVTTVEVEIEAGFAASPATASIKSISLDDDEYSF